MYKWRFQALARSNHEILLNIPPNIPGPSDGEEAENRLDTTIEDGCDNGGGGGLRI